MVLPDTYRKALQTIFSESKTPIEVWAFGSRVNGDSHEASDLDLVVLGDDHESLKESELSMLVEKIRKSNIPILVELHDFYALPQSFQERILNRHIVFYSNKMRIASEPKPNYNS